ncbi:hypothetical protein LCGC14_1484550 [marine sediment metagenome]|uniref:Uncharacterized protein n=1 Tax=marine sediment metagenome TaxID=412755 RepID=A0A0F9J8G9_9ZZZZ
MTPNGQIAIPLDKAANREPFLNETTKRTFEPVRPRSASSKVCGCCQRELQRRQIRQGGKRGLFLVLWGLCVTAAAFDAQSERDFDDGRRLPVYLPSMTLPFGVP